METSTSISTANLNNILEFALSINTHHPVKISLRKALQNGDEEKAWSLVLYYSDWFAIKGWAVARLANDYVMAGKEYYPNGSLKSLVPYVGGVKHGNAATWHKNGKVESQSIYILGKKEGLCINYYETGSKEYECYWKDGLMDGTYIEYTKKGKIYQVTGFVKGKIK